MFTFSHQCWLGTKHIERWEKKNEWVWMSSNKLGIRCMSIEIEIILFQTQLTHLLLSVWYTFILKNKPLFTFPPQFISMLLLNSICPVDLCITCLWCILYQFVKVAKTDVNGVMHQMNFTVLIKKRKKLCNKISSTLIFHKWKYHCQSSELSYQYFQTAKTNIAVQFIAFMDWISREKFSIWKQKMVKINLVVGMQSILQCFQKWEGALFLQSQCQCCIWV